MKHLAEAIRLAGRIEDPELRAEMLEAIGDALCDVTRDASNSKGAIRTRRWREKKASHCDVTVTPPKVPPRPLSSSPPHPPNNYPPLPLLAPLDDSCSSPVAPRRAMEREFEEIWKLFPRKVGKGQALRAYITARKQTDFETIRKGVERHRAQAAGAADPQFVPHPSTWLNGKRWLDEAGLNLVVDNVSDRRGPSRADIEEIERRYCADDA